MDTRFDSCGKGVCKVGGVGGKVVGGDLDDAVRLQARVRLIIQFVLLPISSTIASI